MLPGKYILTLILLLHFFPNKLVAQDAMEFQLFSFNELIKNREETGRSYWQFIDNEQWSAGVYYLKADAEDEQKPHQLDEVYYIIEGRSRFMAGGKETELKQGSILFVKAEVEHRFFDIEVDLQVLVIFTKNNSEDAPDSYFTDFASAKGPILELDNMSVSLSKTINKSGFGVILEGSGQIGAGDEMHEVFSPGVFYVNSHKGYFTLNEIDRIKILTVTVSN